MLAVSGRLDRSVGGDESGELLFKEGEVIDTNRDFFRPNRVKADHPVFTTSVRRSLYLPVVRNAIPDIFALFDGADPNGVTAVRNDTTVASQALFLLNHPFVREQSLHLAKRLLNDATVPDADRVAHGFRLALGRDRRSRRGERRADVSRPLRQTRGGKGTDARGRPARGVAEFLPDAPVSQRVPVCGMTRSSRCELDSPAARCSRSVACGFGGVALAGLLADEAAAGPATDPLAPRAPHFAARAKRVIFLFMHGGVSHVDTFDPKPKLAEMNGKPLPFAKPQFEFGGTGNLLASPWKFQKYGRCGTEVSDLFPHIGAMADDLCVIRSMNGGTEVSHGPACLRLNTGDGVFNRPSLGAWTLYGLGTENRDLPGFVSLSPSLYHGGAQNYGSAFLPASFQGTRVGDGSTPWEKAALANAAPAEPPDLQRLQLDLLGEGEPRPPGNRRGRRPARSPDRGVRDGVPHAGRRAERVRPREGEREDARPVRHRRTSRPTSSAGSACWPGGWSKRGCGSCR